MISKYCFLWFYLTSVESDWTFPQEDCKVDYNSAKLEKLTATELLEKKIAQVKDLKKDVEQWEKKFKVSSKPSM